MKPSWIDYFLEIAKTVASRSDCCRRKVGAVIVQNKQIISTGFNGMPTGMRNCNIGGCPRCSDTSIPSGSELEACLCVHAEANAICQAAMHGLSIKGATIYSTHLPCIGCAKLIINSGISAVKFSESYDNDKSISFLQSAGVQAQ